MKQKNILAAIGFCLLLNPALAKTKTLTLPHHKLDPNKSKLYCEFDNFQEIAVDEKTRPIIKAKFNELQIAEAHKQSKGPMKIYFGLDAAIRDIKLSSKSRSASKFNNLSEKANGMVVQNDSFKMSIMEQPGSLNIADYQPVYLFTVYKLNGAAFYHKLNTSGVTIGAATSRATQAPGWCKSID